MTFSTCKNLEQPSYIWLLMINYNHIYIYIHDSSWGAWGQLLVEENNGIYFICGWFCFFSSETMESASPWWLQQKTRGTCTWRGLRVFVLVVLKSKRMGYDKFLFWISEYFSSHFRLGLWATVHLTPQRLFGTGLSSALKWYKSSTDASVQSNADLVLWDVKC